LFLVARAAMNAVPMTELLDRISGLIGAPERDPELVERTLTDGYARALALEAEQQRLRRELAAAEAELLELRGRLLELRR
jgi:acetate kinase